MNVRHKTKLVKDFFFDSLENRIGLTIRTSQGFFSNYPLRNENIELCQNGYDRILSLRPKQYVLLERYKPSSFIKPNEAFKLSYGLGAKGVLLFLEQAFENLNKTIITFSGIAPISSEFFPVNFSKEYVGKSLPDLLLFTDKNACFAEIKYEGALRTDSRLTGLDDYTYSIDPELWNKYHLSSQKTGHPCFLSIVFNDKHLKNKGVVGSVPINKRVYDNPHIVYREDLIKPEPFFGFLKTYLE